MTLSIEKLRADRNNRAFCRHHFSVLLYRIAAISCKILAGAALQQASRELEYLCWRELGHRQYPFFDGDSPRFLAFDEHGNEREVLIPMQPATLAELLAKAKPCAPPIRSHASVNLESLARLLHLCAFESQWLHWAYSSSYFGRATLPTILLDSEAEGCYVMGLLSELPLETLSIAVVSRRLYTLGFLQGCSSDGLLPLSLNGWLSATDHFSAAINQAHASDSDLLTALCPARYS